MNYITIGKATRLADLEYSTAKNLKTRVRELEVAHAEQGLPPSTIEEKVARKAGSGSAKKLTDDDPNTLLKECTWNRKQRKKL